MVENPQVSRVLVVTAHPDDVDFGAAGSVAAWTDQGVDVSYCICTHGDAGGADSGIPRDRIHVVRRKEQTAAASVVGVRDLHWLGFPDGALEYNLELRKAISRVIRIVRPDRVVCQSPDRMLSRIYASHPDHLAAGAAAIAAVYPDSRNAWAFPDLLDEEGLEPHTVPELWIMAREQPNVFVDITDAVERKIEALLCHESQMSDPGRMPDMIREWARATAQRAEFGPDRFAEGFERVDTA